MFSMVHREVEGLFRKATKRGWEVATWMPQRKRFVPTGILVCDSEIFVGDTTSVKSSALSFFLKSSFRLRNLQGKRLLAFDCNRLQGLYFI